MSESIVFAASSKSAEAPDIEAGIYDARFDGVVAKYIEESKYDPNAFIWSFTLLVEGTDEPVYDDGDPVTTDLVTSQSLNLTSKTVPGAIKALKALMSAKEFALFEAGDTPKSDDLIGRKVKAIVSIKDSGWPKVEGVITFPASKAK
jgi:hypothetical protein